MIITGVEYFIPVGAHGWVHDQNSGAATIFILAMTKTGAAMTVANRCYQIMARLIG